MVDRFWTRSYGTIPSEIDPDAHASVTQMLEQAMTTYAERTAFVSFGASLSYRDIDVASRNFAAFLQGRLGVRKGDRIAVMTPNIVAFPISFIGVIRAGATQVNVNPLYTPRELEHQLNDSGAETIIIAASASATLAEIIGSTKLRNVIIVQPGSGLNGSVPAQEIDRRLAGALVFDDVIAQGAELPFTPVAARGEDVLFLQYTGGTTGPSKGAALTHRNLVANTEQFKAFMGTAIAPGEETIVTAIPLYHIFALMVNFITYFSVGVENWLVANPRDTEGFIDILARSKPTVFVGVNTLYSGLTQHPRLPEVDWSRLKLALGGGASVIETVSDRWKAITGRHIHEGYGLSETSPVLSFNPPSEQAFTGTTGLPMPSTDILLLDGEGKPVGPGEAGEICARGPQVMRGYWEKPEANANAFTKDGYFMTGDIGVFDERGFLKIVDRKKDMIIVSGFNVYPNEIEAVVAACPGVVEAACIGVADEKTGEAVKLFVVRKADSELSKPDLERFCRERLTAYKIPRQIEFLAALPKSNVGKILRKDLRTMS